jgi:hypothetical protein
MEELSPHKRRLTGPGGAPAGSEKESTALGESETLVVPASGGSPWPVLIKLSYGLDE